MNGTTTTTTTGQRPAVPPTVAQLQSHALQLADAFGIRLIESAQLRPDEALALPHIRVVLMSPITEETTYAVALHELGHLCAPSGSLRNVVRGGDARQLQRDEEHAAWAWARHYALVWTAAMETVAQWAEGTYHATPAAPTQPTPKPAAAPTSRIDWTKYR